MYLCLTTVPRNIPIDAVQMKLQSMERRALLWSHFISVTIVMVWTMPQHIKKTAAKHKVSDPTNLSTVPASSNVSLTAILF